MPPLEMIFGYSMGAMQGLHFAALFPSAVRRVVAVCGIAAPSHYNRVFLASLRAALLADPQWEEEEQRFRGVPTRGLEAFGTIYAGWGLSPDFYAEETFLRPAVGDYADLDDFVQAYVQGFSGDEAHNLLAMVQTWDSARIGPIHSATAVTSPFAPLPCLSSVTARTLFLPCATDRYFTPSDARQHAAAVPSAEVLEIPSTWGHRAGDPWRPGQQAQMGFISEQTRLALRT